MKTRLACFIIALPSFVALAHAQTIGGGTCSNATLSGNYAYTLTGRQVSSTGTFMSVEQSNGTANFDGTKNVTFSGTVNTNQATSGPQSITGTYNLPSNCLGTITAGNGSYTLSVYSSGAAFLMTGTDGTSTITAGGSAQPSSCLISSLSGVYAFNANGFTLGSGGAVTGVEDLSGLLQFDGNGNITADINATAGTTTTTRTGAGTYAVSNNCLYTASIPGSTTAKNMTFALSVTNATGADFDLIAVTQTDLFSGTAHNSFTNPGTAVANGASFKANLSPPGTIFSIFGSNLATDTAQAAVLPLPTSLLTTSVTVNGVAAPLFFVSPSQINAQLPVSTKLGLATIVVKTGSTSSNSAAFTVPNTGPGIFTFSQNGETRAVVQNPDFSTNSSTSPAKVGDTLVAYLTGGGPVQTTGLQTGIVAPSALAPVTNNATVTVAGKSASVNYVGLTPGFVGLYQANFVVPTGVAAGDRALVVTIGNQASNAPFITISN